MHDPHAKGKRADNLTRLFEKEQRKLFEADKKSATVISGMDDKKRNANDNAVDRAAWTMVSRQLLNLDETISKE